MKRRKMVVILLAIAGFGLGVAQAATLSLSNPVVDITTGTVTFDYQCNADGGYGFLMRSVDNQQTWQYTDPDPNGNPGDPMQPEVGKWTVDLGSIPVGQFFRIEAYLPNGSTNHSNIIYVQVPDTDLAIDGKNLSLTWNSHIGVTYRIEYRDTLTDGVWDDASGDIIATAAMTSWSILPLVDNRFYRLMVKIGPDSDHYQNIDGIVGYSARNLLAGEFERVAPQFLVGSVAGITLGEAFSGMSDQSVVFVWQGSGYNDYTYYAGYGWFNPSFVLSDDVLIEQGDSVWFKGGASSATVVMAGSIPSAPSIANVLQPGFNSVAYPYPDIMILDDIPVTILSDQDQVFLWNGTGQDDYTYYAGFGWYDAAFQPRGNLPVEIGQGFWLKSAAGGDLIFSTPY